MSEPTPKKPDAKQSAARQRPKASIPVAEPLGAGPEVHEPKTPAASAEVIPVKSSRVILKSRRVLELPPPPVITPPVVETPKVDDLLDEVGLTVRGKGDSPIFADTKTGTVALSGPSEKEPEPSIELDALDIRAKGTWSSLGRRVRIPPRWEQWLTDPQRHDSVSIAAGVGITFTLVVLLAFVFKAPPRPRAAPPLPARTFAAAEILPAAAPTGHAPEAVIRQDAGPLETVAIGPPEGDGGEGANSKSQISDFKSQISDLKPKVSNPQSNLPDAKAADPDHQAPATTASVPPPASDAAPGLNAGSATGPDLLQAADASVQDKFKRRSPGGRDEGVRYGGGTPQSEEAVERAIRWLVAHQRQDGSWSFNHVGEFCEHYCTNPGTEPSTTAATGMALLPFLGAGYTHKQGDFQGVVQRGLDYLKKRGLLISYGNDLRDGSSMYGQALATIALCEAYGMTGDAELKEPAQQALNYIAYAQDLKSGGWRYNPGEPGDTTVTGWMLMALKSGQMAKLNVQTPEIFAAQKFLDSVQNKDGSQYGYLDRKPGRGTTAVGLLCRMYTGWRRTNPGLVKGAAQLGKWGPSKDNIYYDYYATQALFHFAGPEWDDWNRKMRDLLIKSQDRAGHAAGSWYFENLPTSAAGGRLYSTAMAAMILEVYYRFMPLYGEEAVK